LSSQLVNNLLSLLIHAGAVHGPAASFIMMVCDQCLFILSAPISAAAACRARADCAPAWFL